MSASVIRPRRGFTLIELLVVIAIIALLAAILFPVFAKAREKARQTACLNNEKQIGTSVLQYTQDFDEQFPVGRADANGNTGGRGWIAQIYSYAKEPRVFVCPDDPNLPNSLTPISYAININLRGTNITLAQGGTNITQLTAPAKTVFLFEMYYTTNNTNITDWAQEYKSGAGSGLSSSMSATGCKYATGHMFNTGEPANQYPSQFMTDDLGRHSDGSNFLFCDGHAKWLHPSAVSPGGTPTKLGLCAPQPTLWYRADATDCKSIATFSPV